MSADTELERRLSGAQMRLRRNQPFFATLAFFCRQIFRDDIGTAATDGRDIFWNREFLAGLTSVEVDGVLLHELLHAALLHVTRRGPRDAYLWNIACDIVVNGIVEEAGLKLPKGAVRKKEWEKFAVEEVYALLDKHAIRITIPDGWADLLEPGPGGQESIEAHWKQALAQAKTISHSQGQGSLPAGLDRELFGLEPAQLNWRSYLWRYLVRTPTDFSELDRRLVHRGLYVETLQSESVRVFVCIDTSGSIGNEELKLFVGELMGILSAYPHIQADLWWGDADVYGPYRMESVGDNIPRPQGGGGTDFRPFFKAVEKLVSEEGVADGLCVYLTDGYGTFPDPAPSLATLWVVNAGGLDLNGFPFGEAVRLV
ncbi:MAG: VWA-like domain-containing protein [Armatimonas sp.]